MSTPHAEPILALHHLVEGLADPFFAVDGQWRYTHVNSLAAQFMGLTSGDLIGKVLWECFPEALDTSLREEYHHVMKTRETRQFELHYPALDVWLDVKAFAYADGIAVHFRDVTDRRLAVERRDWLLDVTRELARASSQGEVAKAVLSLGLDALNAYAGTVLLVTQDRSALEVAHSVGYGPNARLWRRYVLTDPMPICDAVRTRRGVYVRDHEVPRRYPEVNARRSERTRAVAALPLIVNDEAIGVLAFSFQSDRTFNEAERGFAEALAGQFAQALGRARLLEWHTRSADRLRGLAEAALLINRAPTLDHATTVITEQARMLVGAHQAVTSLTVGEDWRQAITAVSLSDRYASWADYADPPDGSGIYALVCRVNTPMRLTQAELEAHPAWKGFGRHADKHPPMRGWLAVPLVGRDGSNIGLIQLSDRFDGDFTEEDQNILVQLAQLASSSVENARQAQAFRDSEERYRTLVEATNQIVWTAPASGISEQDQPSWRAFTGQSPGEVLGWGWMNAVHPEDRTRIVSAWSAASNRPALFEDELRLRRKDGVFRTMELRAAPVLGADGGVREWVGVLADVTERRAAEAALAERDAELRSMIDSIPQLAWMADGQGWIYWYNERWYDYTGTNFEQMTGWGWRDVHHPGHVERVIEYVGRKWTEGQPWEGTFLLRGRNGEYRWFLTRAMPIRNEHGEVVRWFGTNTDVTEQRTLNELLEERVAERTEQLVKSNRDLEQFAFIASHDLRAPLRTVMSFAQLLQRKYGGKLDANADRYLTLMVDAVDRMNTLIEDVLAFSRVGRDRRMTVVDAQEALNDVLDNVKDIIQSRDADVTHDTLPRVVADGTQLRQVLQNLIGNALKFQPAGRTPRVHVGARRVGGVVHFWVRDNGIGIEPEYFERIFGVFQRLHRSEQFEGTGVGLAIVRKIVEEHGGKVWVESKEGEGTTFHFTLPATGVPSTVVD